MPKNEDSKKSKMPKDEDSKTTKKATFSNDSAKSGGVKRKAKKEQTSTSSNSSNSSSMPRRRPRSQSFSAGNVTGDVSSKQLAAIAENSLRSGKKGKKGDDSPPRIDDPKYKK